MNEPKNFKGTPGEWEAFEHNCLEWSVYSKTGVCVSTSPADDDDYETEKQLISAISTLKADFRLIGQSKRMLAAMQNFCERVEKGEVRSTKTYNEFKEIIKLALGQ